ncbi:hypothetical protein RCL_jg12791.t1 [Rhizophagus clarus]|uniref:Uncharacterized protein n=1 Tax=Rhizophagus clarus TaxID=94130 RepID=A0A8H3KWP8_9GLOM|nr:hypothetical protein RCL_jg12791.t1 [Rhizophagus clarus]
MSEICTLEVIIKIHWIVTETFSFKVNGAWEFWLELLKFDGPKREFLVKFEIWQFFFFDKSEHGFGEQLYGFWIQTLKFDAYFHLMDDFFSISSKLRTSDNNSLFVIIKWTL